MKRPRYTRPTNVEFEEHLHEVGPTEAQVPAVQWIIDECRRARASEQDLRKALRAFRGGRTL